MRAEIILLRKQLDTTFVYVTHDQTEAMTLGDRIVIMKDGFIQQVGTPEEVFEKPHNLFVAEFIGAPKMNIMRTQLLLENGKYYVTPYGAKMLVDGEPGELLKAKKVAPGEILLGVRPEHINLADAAGEDTINGNVLVNEMMGSELHLHVEVEEGTKLICRAPTVNLSHETRAQLKGNHPVHLTFPGKVMYFFDPQTEENLIY
jgi:multiple sugar transport system ATP-binding protein